MDNNIRKKTYKLGMYVFISLILIILASGEIFSLARYMKADEITNINLQITPPPKKLVSGSEINTKIKGNSNAEESNSAITKIVFDYWSNGYSFGGNNVFNSGDWGNGTPVDENQKGAVRLFKSQDGTIVYILSESDIYANVDSSLMFYNFDGVDEFIFNNFNVSNVENMQKMFADCNNLETLDISKFDTLNVTNMKQLFALNSSLVTIYVGENWKTEKVNHTDITEQEEPFIGCENLVGEKGTAYSEENVNISYACVDEGKDGQKQGYLTFKENIKVMMFAPSPNKSDKKENTVKEENFVKTENVVNSNENVTAEGNTLNIGNVVEVFSNEVKSEQNVVSNSVQNQINESTNSNFNDKNEVNVDNTPSNDINSNRVNENLLESNFTNTTIENK